MPKPPRVFSARSQRSRQILQSTPRTSCLAAKPRSVAVTQTRLSARPQNFEASGKLEESTVRSASFTKSYGLHEKSTSPSPLSLTDRSSINHYQKRHQRQRTWLNVTAAIASALSETAPALLSSNSRSSAFYTLLQNTHRICLESSDIFHILRTTSKPLSTHLLP